MGNEKKVRWGVLSTAKIGRTQVLPAMRNCASVELAAIASRAADSARSVAKELGMPKWYDSYEALLADPDIDAVYVPLPNHLHIPWAVKALEAGKHVLCEKPVALSKAEAQRLIDAATAHPKLKVMEAFMYRFHPQWTTAMELISSGAIGEPQTIQSFFSYYNDDPANIRNISEYGGGAMMDIGCYCISLSRWVFGGEPNQVLGQMDRDPKFGTDRHAHCLMDFGGRISTFTCSTQLEWHQRVFILGSGGSIEIMIPFNPPIDVPTVVRLRQGETEKAIELAPCSHYGIQGELFSQAILKDGPVPTPLEDAAANLHVLEALMRSAKTRSWTDC